MKKTPNKIKKQIEAWLLNYKKKQRDKFNGYEGFTFFDLLTINEKESIKSKVNLRYLEIPVLVLKIKMETHILNTTERFVYIDGIKEESIEYKDFEYHSGYKHIFGKGNSVARKRSIKQNGGFQDFGLRKRSGDVIFWTIPTGDDGFAFWNVTKKCELIGRKYDIEKNI